MKYHHLTLYRGQVWGSKTYHDLCNNNVLYVLSESNDVGLRSQNNIEKIEENGQLYVSPVPGWGFIHKASMIPWHSEILQSFAELTNSAQNMLFTTTTTDRTQVSIKVGQLIKYLNDLDYHDLQSLPPNNYFREYIWTKEGFKLN